MAEIETRAETVNGTLRTTSSILWAVGGGAIFGWIIARAASWVMDNPVIADTHSDGFALLRHFTQNILWIDPRCWEFFWSGFAFIVIVCVGCNFFDRVRELARKKPDFALNGNDPEMLAKLAHDKEWFIRGNVALNPHTPIETLAELAHDKDEDVRIAASMALDARSA